MHFCGLCAKSCEVASYSLSDEIIKDLIFKTTVELKVEPSPTYLCCGNCYTKAKFFVKFLNSIEEAQNVLLEEQIHKQRDPLVSVDIKEERVEAPAVKFVPTSVNKDKRQRRKTEPEPESDDGVIKSSTRKKPVSKKVKMLSNEFKCGKCKKTHASYEDLEKHITECFQNPTLYSCIVCHKYFDTNKGLSIHIGVHHKGVSV